MADHTGIFTQISIAACQLDFGFFMKADLLREEIVGALEAWKLKSGGKCANQSDDGHPRDEASQGLEDARDAVDRVIENNGIDKMGGAASEDESAEKPKEARVFHLGAFSGYVEGDRERDGEISGKNREVRDDMKPSVARAPVTASPARWEVGRVEKLRKESNHLAFATS